MKFGSALLGALLFFAGCNSDIGLEGALVGGSCRDYRDCERECVGGRNFPDGMCTVYCRDDRDCPSGTGCIDRNGGVCALYCEADADCRREYDCEDVRRRGGPGDERVCIGD